MRFLLSAVLRSGSRHLPASPYVHPIEAEDYELINYQLAATSGWVDLPITKLGVMQGLVLLSDQTIGVRVYRQINGEITVEAGGVFVLWDCHVRLDTLVPVELNYVGTTPAHIRAFACGVGHEAV
jgi:hypothetical protein